MYLQSKSQSPHAMPAEPHKNKPASAWRNLLKIISEQEKI